MAQFWKSFFQALEIKLPVHCTSSTNQTVKQYLQCFSSSSSNNRLSVFPLAEFSYNYYLQSSVNQILYFANYSFHTTIITGLAQEVSVPAVQGNFNFFQDNILGLPEFLKQAERRHKFYSDQMRQHYYKFQVGNKHWLSTFVVRFSSVPIKLAPRCIALYSIIKLMFVYVPLLKPFILISDTARESSATRPIT